MISLLLKGWLEFKSRSSTKKLNSNKIGTAVHKHPDDESLQVHWKTKQSYNDLSVKELNVLISQLGYTSKLSSPTESNMKKLLNKESLESGNAGQRIDCGIIARSAS